MAKKLKITEIYLSVQGESSYTGLPCVFIRLTGCPLRCRWCDTVYGFEGGKEMSVSEVLAEIDTYDTNLVELTGGEPLAQENAAQLVKALSDRGYKILIETGGSVSVEKVVEKAHVIMDLKCPGSKMHDQNLYSNFDLLKPSDEIKFVIADREDFDWAKDKIKEYDLSNRFHVLMSPAWGLVHPSDLVEWMLETKTDARLNLQTHKYIWSPTKKGV